VAITLAVWQDAIPMFKVETLGTQNEPTDWSSNVPSVLELWSTGLILDTILISDTISFCDSDESLRSIATPEYIAHKIVA